MLSLLDPRMWLAAATLIAATFGLGFFKGGRYATHRDGLEQAAAIAVSNVEARKMEQLRQRGVDDALRANAAREVAIRSDTANARSDVDSLHATLDAVERASQESLATSNRALRVASDVFADCTRQYIEVAEGAARADSEARKLRQGWPQ